MHPNLPTPDSDKPATARLLHTDGVSASLDLILVDATTGERGDDLLTLKSRAHPKNPGITGTGEEMADIALAVLQHVLTRPAVCVEANLLTALEALSATAKNADADPKGYASALRFSVEQADRAIAEHKGVKA